MSDWFGFPCEEFLFEGRKAFLVFPKEADAQKNWTLKTEYRDAFPETELELLHRGFHAAFLTNHTRFGTTEDCDAKDRFAAYLHETYGLCEKCVPIGMSCGGAHAVQFAGYYPNRVKCMFIDAPVLNFLDFPARYGDPYCESVWETEFTRAYPGISRAKLLSFTEHPLNRIDALKTAKIPILLVYGTQDTTVFYAQNGKMMEEAYNDAPELLTVMARDYQGHHPHGFPHHPEIIADYICLHSK